MTASEYPTFRRSAYLGESADHPSPSGASEIRLLIQREEGEITHATCPAGRIAEAATVRGARTR